MKALSDVELAMNAQAVSVASSVLGEPVVAATRCEQITPEMTEEAAGLGAGMRATSKFSRGMGNVMAKGVGMGNVVDMGKGLRGAGLPNTFVLAVTATKVVAIEDKHKDGQLQPGKELKSWDRQGLMAKGGGTPFGITADDRQELTLYLPLDDGQGKQNKYLAAAQSQMAKAGAPGMPTKFLVGKDPASQAVIDEIGSQQAFADASAAHLAAHPELAAQMAAGQVRIAGMSAAPAPAADPVAQLEKLAALHASGALTAEEFAAQKAKLLG